MTYIYKTTFPPEMSGAQRNFVIEMIKRVIPQSTPNVIEEIENAIIPTTPNLPKIRN